MDLFLPDQTWPQCLTRFNRSGSDLIKCTEFLHVTTAEITDITSTTAKSGGSVLSEFGSPVVARGVCWGKDYNYLRPNNYNTPSTSDGIGLGSFSSSITDLLPNTTYYVRAYAKKDGSAYYFGNTISFKTSP